jgi:cytochrome P450
VRRAARAITEPGDDFFSALCQSEYRGRKLTREEVAGYANLAFAGGRVCPHGAQVHGVSVANNDRIGLCWASANRDETVFEAPDEVRIDRMPNPHVGFGFGKHACLGASQARLILRTLLADLAASVSSIELLDAEANWETEDTFRRQVGFDYLNVSFNA